MLSKTSMIVLAVVAGAVAALLPLTIPIAGFAFNGFLLNHVIDTVGWDDLIDRTKDLPEVKAFMERYPETKPMPFTDYHIGIAYAVTECDLTGIGCGTPQYYTAFLEIVMDDWFGYPEKSIFGCQGHAESYPLRDEYLIERIKAGC